MLNYENTTRGLPSIVHLNREGGSHHGYGWLALILPYVEEASTWEGIYKKSEGLIYMPFGYKGEGIVDGAGKQFGDREISLYRCPTYSGDTIVDTTIAYPNALGFPTVGNYKAFFATHIGYLELAPGLGAPALIPWDQDFFNDELFGGLGQRGNAALDYKLPLGIEEIEDGLSKTLLATESREQRFGSWYATGAGNHGMFGFNYIEMGVVGLMSTNVDDNPVPGDDGHIVAAKTSLNVGPKHLGDPARYYPSFGIFPTSMDWGPSSEHAGGLVNHVFADGHVISIPETADPTAYLRLISRNGGEQVSEEALQ